MAWVIFQQASLDVGVTFHVFCLVKTVSGVQCKSMNRLRHEVDFEAFALD